MPLDASSLIVTVGGSTSNSYATHAEAQAYHDANLGAEAWFDAEEANQVRALLKAARRLERENWDGSRVDTTQVLAWPRAGVYKPDSAGGYYGEYFYGGTQFYQTTEIPQVIKDAQCELALAYLDGFQDGEGDSIASWQADDVRIDYRQSRPDGALPSTVMRLIGPLIAGPQLVRA